MFAAYRLSALMVAGIVSLAACEDVAPTAPVPPAASEAGPLLRATSAVVMRTAVRDENVVILGPGKADIESVEVIKGPATQALYGKQCDMVIVIRTKPRPADSPPSAAAK